MTKLKVDLIILEKYKKRLLDRYSLLYGNKYLNDIKKRLDAINELVVTDELESHVPMCFYHDIKKIEMNSNFLEFDRYGRLISFNGSTSIYLEHSLIHELLHAASDKANYSGITIGNGSDGTGLNEGITQMFADDICGYVENKYLGSYSDLKVAAKILRCTFGNDVMCEEYFKERKGYQNGILESRVNSLANNSKYYDELLNQLTVLNKMFVAKITNDKKGQTDEIIYRKKCELVFKNIVLNIVIPHLLRLNYKEKQSYLTRLMLDIGEDDELKRTIKAIISEYYNKSDLELLNAKKKLEEENEVLDRECQYVSMLRNDNNVGNKYYVKNDGTVLLLGNPTKEVTSGIECALVYSKIFEKEYHFDEKLYDSIIENLSKGRPLNIKYKDVKSRRIVYCGIVARLRSKGYTIINNYKELDNHYQIAKPLLLKIPFKNNSFSDLGKVYNKYEVKEEKNKLVVKDRTFGYTVDDLIVVIIAKFANLWRKVFNISGNDNIVFSNLYETYFKEVMNAINYAYVNRNDFDLNCMLTKCKSNTSKSILRGLMSNPTRVEIVFEFFSYIVGKSPIIQEKKGRSYSELSTSDYMEKVAYYDAASILGK